MRGLREVRRSGELTYLRPDGKSQVTVEYVDGKPARIDAVVVSTQHGDDVSTEQLRADIRQVHHRSGHPAQHGGSRTPNIHINPTGRFVIGGPHGDTGLTGRKIIVDTYGGMGRHGGGAFSGKDPTKVDRSACYMARYIAKNIVAAGLAERVRSAAGLCHRRRRAGFGHGRHLWHRQDAGRRAGSPNWSAKISRSLRRGIIEHLNLRRPIYQKTAAFGHFGRTEDSFTWETTDKVEALRDAAQLTAAAV